MKSIWLGRLAEKDDNIKYFTKNKRSNLDSLNESIERGLSVNSNYS